MDALKDIAWLRHEMRLLAERRELLENVAVAAQALLDAREAVLDAMVDARSEQERHALQVAAKYATNQLREALALLAA